MKKLFFLVLLISNFFGYTQYTSIPDVNFEKALIDFANNEHPNNSYDIKEDNDT